MRVVVYNPIGRPDILLVATRPYFELEWTPLLRIDLPKATRFSVYRRADSH